MSFGVFSAVPTPLNVPRRIRPSTQAPGDRRSCCWHLKYLYTCSCLETIKEHDNDVHGIVVEMKEACSLGIGRSPERHNPEYWIIQKDHFCERCGLERDRLKKEMGAGGAGTRRKRFAYHKYMKDQKDKYHNIIGSRWWQIELDYMRRVDDKPPIELLIPYDQSLRSEMRAEDFGGILCMYFDLPGSQISYSYMRERNRIAFQGDAAIAAADAKDPNMLPMPYHNAAEGGTAEDNAAQRDMAEYDAAQVDMADRKPAEKYVPEDNPGDYDGSKHPLLY